MSPSDVIVLVLCVFAINCLVILVAELFLGDGNTATASALGWRTASAVATTKTLNIPKETSHK